MPPTADDKEKPEKPRKKEVTAEEKEKSQEKKDVKGEKKDDRGEKKDIEGAGDSSRKNDDEKSPRKSNGETKKKKIKSKEILNMLEKVADVEIEMLGKSLVIW